MAADSALRVNSEEEVEGGRGIIIGAKDGAATGERDEACQQDHAGMFQARNNTK
jgi:hypothetical protein